MPIELKVKVTKIGNSLRMTIPQPVVEALGIKEGDILGVSVTDGELIARRRKPAD